MPDNAFPSPAAVPSSAAVLERMERALRRRMLLGVGLWTLLVLASLILGVRAHQRDALENAELVANAYVDKDLMFRAWVTRHGGVYVKPSEQTLPNPWLQVPDRDVVTRDGMALTLVNPAYATREVLEEFSSKTGIRGHLTSLKLKNPNNAPDEWEVLALKRLDRGLPFVSEQLGEGDGQVLRLMRPVFMEKGCMSCHADMGIPVGGVRGGLSVSLPMAPYQAIEADSLRMSLISHGGFWLLGLLGLGMVYPRGREGLRVRAQAEFLRFREARRATAVLSLSERFDSLGEADLIREGLETAEALSESRLGFFHFVNEDQTSLELSAWTRETLHHCQAVYDSHYPLDQAGVWADCARQRRPIIHNDYGALPNKRGLPEGHAPLNRLLTVPVIEGGLVRVIMGVGNKTEPYESQDEELLQTLANDIWRMVQRKRAETRLRASERLLREAQQVAHMGSWSLDHGSGEMVWSEEVFRILGLEPGSVKAELASLLGGLPPEEQARVKAQLEAAMAEHREYRSTLRLTLPEGGVKKVLIQGLTNYTPGGQPRTTVGTLQDVSEQERIESLRRSEANLTALFENTERMIWSVDTQLHLVVGNNRFLAFMEEQTGGRLAPGSGIPFESLAEPLAQAWRQGYEGALAGQEQQVEVQLPGTGGQPCWLEFQFVPIHDDEDRLAGVTVFGLDFTGRKQEDAARLEAMVHMQRLLGELETLHSQTLLVNNLNDLLQSCRDEGEAYSVISLALGELFPRCHGCLALVQEGGDLERVSLWGEGLCRKGQGFAMEDCWGLRRGSLHEVEDIAHGLVCQHLEGLPRAGYFCLPLIVRGETLGLLHLAYPDQVTAAQRASLISLAQSVGETVKLSLSNLRLRLAMQDQAIHDPLTGLFNRRYLDEILPRELSRAQRTNSRLALGMLDIDHFKRFNDSLGHEVGDLVLREIGRLLHEYLRKSDIACRYGGEELLVIMPDSTAADAAQRLEAMRQLIHGASILHQGKTLPAITLSVGVAEAFVHGSGPQELLRHADQALYRAKAEGRDRVVVAAVEGPGAAEKNGGEAG